MTEDKCWAFKANTPKVKLCKSFVKAVLRSAKFGQRAVSCQVQSASSAAVALRDILKGHTDSEGSRYSRLLLRIATGVAKDSNQVLELASERRQHDNVLQRCGI